MGWDIVEIGLKHKLPVNDPYATAQEVAKRLKVNIQLVAHNLFEYDSETDTVSEVKKGDKFIELQKFNYDNSDKCVKLIVHDYQIKKIKETIGKDRLRKTKFSSQWAKDNILDFYPFELYEIEDDEKVGIPEIRIFTENIDIAIPQMMRWGHFDRLFRRNDEEAKEYLRKIRKEILDVAKAFECEQVIICADQGPTESIFDNMDMSADDLLEYTMSLKNRETHNGWFTKDWKANARYINFADYFKGTLNIKEEEYVVVVFDQPK